MSDVIQSWVVLGRDEDSDGAEGPWWPLYRAGPPIRAKSAANAITQACERLTAAGESDWVEFAAVPLDVWETRTVE